MKKLLIVKVCWYLFLMLGSNDYDFHKKIKKAGRQIIILDHHEAEHVSEDAIVINNQLSNYPNKELSGAGVT